LTLLDKVGGVCVCVCVCVWVVVVVAVVAAGASTVAHDCVYIHGHHSPICTCELRETAGIWAELREAEEQAAKAQAPVTVSASQHAKFQAQRAVNVAAQAGMQPHGDEGTT
jgi:hypothetical protein